MPAVIDTGGPRVLHRVERVETLILRSPKILSASETQSDRSFRVRRSSDAIDVHPYRPIAEKIEFYDTCDHRTHGTTEKDERTEYSEKSSRATWSGRSDPEIASNGLVRSTRVRDWKHCDAVERRRIKRLKRLGREIREVPGNNESSKENEVSGPGAYGPAAAATLGNPSTVFAPDACLLAATSLASSSVDDVFSPTAKSSPSSPSSGRPSTSTSSGAPDAHQGELSSRHVETQESFAFSSSHLTVQSRDARTGSVSGWSPILTRLSAGDGLGEVCRDPCRGNADALAISSQRVFNTGECCVSGRCRASLTPELPVSTKSLKDSTGREMRRPRILETGKSASYVQLIILLFLIVFGNGNPFRVNSATLGPRNAGAGVRLLTIAGTLVGAVRSLPVDLDAGVRAERSANLSHISGASRKIQMYIKNRHLQILPDGTVNGSTDDTSDYTIFQRTSVSRGQLRIQGVATCLYLCMDSCGLLYGSRDYTEECVFNETLEQHNYNTYSSVRWSTPKKSLYLGLNRRGQPRRVQAKGHNLGRLSAYARVLTQVAPAERVEALHARMLGAHHAIRHRHNANHQHHQHSNHHDQHRRREDETKNAAQTQQSLCPQLPPQEKDGRDKFRCRKRKKRKKWRRRCPEGEKVGPHCASVDSRGVNAAASLPKSQSVSGEFTPTTESKRSCEGEASEELCRKQALDAPAKKRKSRIEQIGRGGSKQKRRKDSKTRKKEDKTIGDGTRRDGTPMTRRRRPSNGARSAGFGTRKRPIGRTTRTIIANSTIPAVTLPSSWYPTSTTFLAERSREASTALPISTRTTITRYRNSVTDHIASKDQRRARLLSLALDGDREEIGKSSEARETSAYTSGATTIVTTEATSSSEDRSALTASDWSSETSDEVKSDESISLQDDETTANYGDYSTQVATMDTTPPRRTEDYTGAAYTTVRNLVDRASGDGTSADFSKGGTDESFERRARESYERLAM